MIYYLTTAGMTLLMFCGVALAGLGMVSPGMARWTGIATMTLNVAFSLAVGAIDSAALYGGALVVWMCADPKMYDFLTTRRGRGSRQRRKKAGS